MGEPIQPIGEAGGADRSIDQKIGAYRLFGIDRLIRLTLITHLWFPDGQEQARLARLRRRAVQHLVVQQVLLRALGRSVVVVDDRPPRGRERCGHFLLLIIFIIIIIFFRFILVNS